MKTLCEFLEELDPNRRNLLYTLLEGEHAGEKLLLSGGETVFSSAPGGFLETHRRELDEAPAGEVTKVGGRRVFADLLGSESRMVVCGGGHVALPVIRLAKALGFSVTVLEDRQEFAERAREAGADQVFADGYRSRLQELPGTPDTYYVILTRGHLFDRECLESCIRKPSAYIGMIGSRRKVQLVRETMLSEGYRQEELDRVHAPVGLPIGAETPEEIAVSILAEVISVRSARHRNDLFPEELLRALLETPERGHAVLAEIIRKTGSAPRGVGSRMAVFEDGSIAGTVGGGSGEAEAIECAREMLKREPDPERFRLLTVRMDAESAAADGLICGGTIELMMECAR